MAARPGTPGMPGSAPAPAPAVPAPPVLVTNTGNSNGNRNSNSVAAVPAVPANNPPPLRLYPTHNCKTRLHTHKTYLYRYPYSIPHPTVVMPSCCCTLFAMLKTRLVAAPRFPRFGAQGFPQQFPVPHPTRAQEGRRMLLTSLQISLNASEK